MSSMLTFFGDYFSSSSFFENVCCWRIRSSIAFLNLIASFSSAVVNLPYGPGMMPFGLSS
jgi:hypothetical protein